MANEWEQRGRDVYRAAPAPVALAISGDYALLAVRKVAVLWGSTSDAELRAAAVGYLVAHLDAGGRVG